MSARLRLEKLEVQEEWDVLRLRKLAMTHAEELGFSQPKVYRFGTSVSELGYNLLLHARDGRWLSIYRLHFGLGLEVIAQDEGPGIVDLAWAMEDGNSSNGGLGGGLPGVKRMMDEFEISTEVRTGTTVTARLWL